MSNTVTSISYANTFGEWMVATNALINENNILAAGDYTKSSGTIYLNETTQNSLQANGTVIVQKELRVQGTGSSATVEKNMTVGGQVYFTNTTLGLTHSGQANLNGLVLVQGPNIGISVSNNAYIGGNTTIRYNTISNNVQANSSVNTSTVSVTGVTFTDVLQANTSTLTDVLNANTKIYTNILQSNTDIITSYLQANNKVNTSVVSATTQVIGNSLQANNTIVTGTLSANTSANINTLYANTISANVSATIPSLTVNTKLDGNSAAAFLNSLQVQGGGLTVNGNFTLTGTTVYASNTFQLSTGVSSGISSYLQVDRGSSGANAALRWNEPQKYWDFLNVTSNTYYRVLTDEYFNDTLTNTSTTLVATANAVNAVFTQLTTANNFLQAAGVAAGSYANSAFVKANAAYSLANTFANTFVGTTGSVSQTSGVISFTSNNGVTIVATTANNLAVSTSQDLRTSASPTFAGLTLTSPLALSQGGTGATSASSALTNILPTGTTSGYVLTTGGPGNFYWAAASGGGGGATPGTSINSTRLTYTANGAAGYAGNTFTTPTWTTSTQLRAYINGVRQFESEYSANSAANTISFTTAPASGDAVLIEVDGYYVNPYYANNIAYTVNSNIDPTANTIQLAIDGLTSKVTSYYANLAGSPTFTTVATGVTVAAGTSNTAFATTAYVQNLANNSGTLTTSITGNAGTVTNGVYTSGSYANPSWITSLANTKISGVITGSQLANTAVTTGTYGGASQMAVVTVDQQGRVTSAANVTPSIANTQITGVITGSQGGNPTGTILMWPTASAPTGYLAADGTAVSRTTYAALFAVIGTVFGAGDGSTTFNLPNYTNRMPIGAGVTGPLSVSVGSTGGSANAIVVSHTHTATSTDSGHIHSYSGHVDPVNKFLYSAGGGNTGIGQPYNSASNTATSTANITTTIDTAGSSGTNANLPPYLGIYFIIKT